EVAEERRVGPARGDVAPPPAEHEADEHEADPRPRRIVEEEGEGDERVAGQPGRERLVGDEKDQVADQGGAEQRGPATAPPHQRPVWFSTITISAKPRKTSRKARRGGISRPGGRAPSRSSPARNRAGAAPRPCRSTRGSARCAPPPARRRSCRGNVPCGRRSAAPPRSRR